MAIDMSPIGQQTTTPIDLLRLPSQDELRDAFVGKNLSSLRTPAIILDRTRFKANCEAMAATCMDRNIAFRAHVKTHKTVEGLRMQLEAGQGCRAVICSTLMECWQIESSGLVEEGLVQDMLYGLPAGVDRLGDLQRLSVRLHDKNAVLRLMIDHPGQIQALPDFPLPGGRKWSIFIKVDGGGRRAGLPADSVEMRELLSVAVSSPYVEIHGFYSHFGQSYASKDTDEALSFLHGEVACVNTAAGMALELGARPNRPYVLSVGATPTAHAARVLENTPLNGALELHAGNYCCLDLQQVATNLKSFSDVATSVLTRILSIYPHRQEALCDAGGLAMARDGGPLSGFGRVVWPAEAKGWDLGRMAQEHGVLSWTDEKPGGKLHLGDCLRIVGQHSCVTLAAHPWYYCVDEGGETVVDVWVPWKGW